MSLSTCYSQTIPLKTTRDQGKKVLWFRSVNYTEEPEFAFKRLSAVQDSGR